MPVRGHQLAVDLNELYILGSHIIPLAAQELSKANGHVADTEYGLTSAFRRADPLGLGPCGAAYDAWKTLRDEFQTILADLSKNLEDVANALLMTADEYAKRDADTQAELDRMKKDDLRDYPPVGVSPPRYPESARPNR